MTRIRRGTTYHGDGRVTEWTITSKVAKAHEVTLYGRKFMSEALIYEVTLNGEPWGSGGPRILRKLFGEFPKARRRKNAGGRGLCVV